MEASRYDVPCSLGSLNIWLVNCCMVVVNGYWKFYVWRLTFTIIITICIKFKVTAFYSWSTENALCTEWWWQLGKCLSLESFFKKAKWRAQIERMKIEFSMAKTTYQNWLSNKGMGTWWNVPSWQSYHDFLILLLLLGSSEFKGEALLVFVPLAVPFSTGEVVPCILLFAMALLLSGVLSSVCSMVAGLAGMSYCVGVIPRRSSIKRSWVSASWHSLCLAFICVVWPCCNWSWSKIEFQSLKADLHRTTFAYNCHMQSAYTILQHSYNLF